MAFPYTFSRRLGRVLLKWLAQAVLRKHRPEIIAVMGDGPTSLLREALYAVFHEEYPTRRNLESPEAEFSVPLAVIGYPTYPMRWREWLLLILKTTLQLIFFKKYHHYLILEMGTTNKESFLYWLEITHPQLIIILGHLSPDLEKSLPPTKVMKEEATSLENFELYQQLALKVTNLYGIAEARARHHLLMLNWPSSRLHLVKTREGKIILDATYHYWPIPWTAVLEVAEGLPGNKIVVLDQNLVSHETSQIKYPIIKFFDTEKIKDYAVIILRGPKSKFQKFMERLVS